MAGDSKRAMAADSGSTDTAVASSWSRWNRAQWQGSTGTSRSPGKEQPMGAGEALACGESAYALLAAWPC
jgi:hypothetical protein